TLTYAVARAEPTNDRGNEGRGYYTAWGCTDGIVSPEVGDSTIIEIPLRDLWPDAEGDYTINTEMDWFDLVPDNVQLALDPIIDFFESPALGILEAAALAYCASQNDCDVNDPDERYFAGFFGDVFDGYDSDGNLVPGTFYSIALDAVDGLIEWGLGQAGSAGQTTLEVFNTINVVFENLENFRFRGTLRIPNDPDQGGSLGSNIEISFNEIILVCTGDMIGLPDCPAEGAEVNLVNERADCIDTPSGRECNRGSFLEANGVTGAIGWHPNTDDRENTYAVSITGANLTFTYGDLILFVLEKFVFPNVICPTCPIQGETATTFEDFANQIVNCEDWTSNIDNQTLSDIVEGLCDGARDLIVQQLVNLVTGLSTDFGENFVMQTFGNNPCHVGLPGAVPQFTVSSMGSSDDVCEWDMQVRYSDGSDPELVDSTWYAEFAN
ncbi:MAG: hypothetical protein KC561_10520, partial [Myxococcales bacterium]|nr:hypothetical protein [Myxococcales bacterium]